jgi:hypothetical protein
MDSTFDSSIFPKNLRVRWIFPGFTHRTSLREDFKSSWISSIFFRTVTGISIARKDRINKQEPLLYPPFEEKGVKGGSTLKNVNTIDKKVNERRAL